MEFQIIFIVLGLVSFILSGFLFFSKKNMEKKLIEEKDTLLEENSLQRNIIQNFEKKDIEQEAELRILKSTKDQLEHTFKSLANDVFAGNSKQFLELAKTSFDQQSQVAKSDLEQRQQSISSVMNPIKETLDKYQTQLFQIEKERQRSYAEVEGELKRVVMTSLELSKETTALKNALKRPHIRGRWGEVQLKNCIELAGMSEYADVTFQDSHIDSEGARYIPDMTVKMPGGRVVIVDSKAPFEAFLLALDAETEAARATEMVRHGKHVRSHIQQLSEKKYAEKIKNSADFTVMFLPNESFLYAALESQPDLVEYGLEKKILIATPPMLIGLLKVIHFGWNEEKLAENAQKISEVGKELHKRVVDFFEAYEEVGNKLNQAQKAFDKGRMRLNSRVLTKAQQLETLGAKSAKNLPKIESLNL